MMKKTLLSLLLAATGLLGACANDVQDQDEMASVDSDLSSKLSDAQLQGKLRGILEGVTLTSESDYPYLVIEGEAVPQGTRLSTRIVREKLAAAIIANTEERRDISLSTCRSSRLDVGETIASGDAAQVPADEDADDYTYARHDKQLGIALKTMRSHLKSVVGFEFGMDEYGNQDELGPVVIVYVGVSKTTGKLIAILSEAVRT